VTKKKTKRQAEPQAQKEHDGKLSQKTEHDDSPQVKPPPPAEKVAAERQNTADTAVTEQENSDCQNKLLRLAAEFENYKKRMVRERETYLKYAEENILRELLPSIDNLERALNHEPGNSELSVILEGVELTLKGLLNTIKKFGLEAIESTGKPFDPNFHEALVMEDSDDVPPQHVIREFEKGYQYKDRLLRAAKVVVSKGKTDS